MQNLEDGIYTSEQISDKMYFTDNTRVTASKLKTLFNETPYHLNMKKEFSGSSFGSAFHLRLESVEKFVNNVITFPDERGYSSATTKTAKLFIAENKDKIVLTVAELELLNTMFDTTQKREDITSQKIWDLINQKEAIRENIILFTLKIGEKEVKCKAKIDLILFESMLVDYKTVSKLSNGQFQKDYNNFEYWLSMGFYQLAIAKHFKKEIIDIENYIFAFEKQAPFICQDFRLYIPNDVFTLINKLVLEYDNIINKKYKYGYSKNGESLKLEVNSYKINDIRNRIK